MMTKNRMIEDFIPHIDESTFDVKLLKESNFQNGQNAQWSDFMKQNEID